MHIRKAMYEDKDQVAVLFKEMMEFHCKRDTIFALKETGPERYAIYFVSEISNELALPLIAEANGLLIAFSIAIVRKYPGTWKKEIFGEINDIGVTEQCRRSGIGKLLMEKSIEWLKTKNVNRIELKVASSNEVSKSFYKKLGFSPYLETMFLYL